MVFSEFDGDMLDNSTMLKLVPDTIVFRLLWVQSLCCSL